MGNVLSDGLLQSLHSWAPGTSEHLLPRISQCVVVLLMQCTHLPSKQKAASSTSFRNLLVSKMCQRASWIFWNSLPLALCLALSPRLDAFFVGQCNEISVSVLSMCGKYSKHCFKIAEIAENRVIFQIVTLLYRHFQECICSLCRGLCICFLYGILHYHHPDAMLLSSQS